MKEAKINRKISPQEAELIESLLKYPTLETVFDMNGTPQLTELKRRMQATVDDLERVIRRGSKTDAQKASKVVEAYRIALNFLVDLETIRQTSRR